MKLIVCKLIEYCAVKNNFVDCRERVRCNWSYGLGLGLKTKFFGLCLGLGLEPCGLVNITAQVSRYQKGKTNLVFWILLKQEIVSGSGISWVICKSARRSRQITSGQCSCQNQPLCNQWASVVVQFMSHRASVYLCIYSTMRERQRIARVHLRQLTLV